MACRCIPAYSDRDYWQGSLCEECEARMEGDERDHMNEAHADAPEDYDNPDLENA